MALRRKSKKLHSTVTLELHDERRFHNGAEAENHALAMGRHWVNNRLQRMQKDP